MEGNSDSSITPHTIVKTGWRRRINEVYTAGNLGNEYDIANHPKT